MQVSLTHDIAEVQGHLEFKNTNPLYMGTSLIRNSHHPRIALL